MSKSFPTPSKTFFILFFLHLFLSLVLRLTGQLEQRIFNEILIYGALAYSMIGSQWNYDPSYLKTSSVLFLLYLLHLSTKIGHKTKKIRHKKRIDVQDSSTFLTSFKLVRQTMPSIMQTRSADGRVTFPILLRRQVA